MTGLNSGVLLLHLARMRADDDVWARLLHAAAAKLEQQPRVVRLGWLADQTFVSFLAAWQFGAHSLYPPHDAPLGDRLYTVPCGWNRQLSVHAANTPNFWPNWASCTEPCRFAYFAECRKLAAVGDLITCLPRAEGAFCSAEGARGGRPSAPLARAFGPITSHSAKLLHTGTFRGSSLRTHSPSCRRASHQSVSLYHSCKEHIAHTHTLVNVNANVYPRCKPLLPVCVQNCLVMTTRLKCSPKTTL